MNLHWDNITFVNPELFALLLILPLGIFWYYWRSKNRYPELTFSSLGKVAHLKTWRTILRQSMPLFRSIAFIALVTALARPQETLKEEEIKAEGIDIMLVMDLSSSMLAQDFKPDRMEVSKRVAGEFVDKRSFDRIGLAVFAGEAFTQCPLTTDHKVVREFLSNLKCGYLEDGTAIGMGLATAVNRLKDSEAESKVVILLTDGVNNAGYIKPLTASEIAEEYNVKVYTIGVGTTGDALTPVSRRSDGKYIFGFARVEIDEDLLVQIAEMTGGRYFRATTESALAEIYAEIDRLEKTEIEVTSINRYSEEYRPFLLIGLLFLFLEILLKHSVLRTVP